MANGTVKWFNAGKGYGFIKQNKGGDDLFVHMNEVDGDGIVEGDEVEYEVGEGKKGPCAMKVSKS